MQLLVGDSSSSSDRVSVNNARVLNVVANTKIGTKVKATLLVAC